MSAEVISLWTYFSECFVPFQNLSIPLKPLHKGVCDALESALMGDLHKSYILINIPPRVGKTKMLEAACTWMYGLFPDSQIIYTSYSNMLAGSSSKYCQEVMKTDWYREIFPTRLGNIQQADHFTTEGAGMMHADGVGGALTGLGAGLKRRAGGMIVVDDPTKPDEALSAVESEKIRFWFENTLKSRRNSSTFTPIIICMQRLDTDDLTGFVLENYPNDVHHIKFSGFVNGESTIPETKTTQDMLDSQRVNPFAFAAQICQEPIILGGNLIKLADFRYYPQGQPPKIEHKLITCDTAMKSKTSNDHSVLQCWGRSEKRAFLIDQIRGRWEPAELIANSKRFYSKHHKASSPIAYMAIEEAAAGTTLMGELRKQGIPARGIVRTKDKVTRILEALPYQATGMVWLPRGAAWLPAFEAEIAQFRKDGKSTKDDQCVVGGTLVETDRGPVRADCVEVGDCVMTRRGWQKVLRAEQTGEVSEMWILETDQGHQLRCTGSHPVWTEEKGFLRVDSLIDGITLRVWSHQHQSFLTASLSAVTHIVKLKPTEIIIGPRGISCTGGYSTSTKRFGNPITRSRFQRDTSSTTRTGTLSTTTLRTWWRSLKRSIWPNTADAATSCPTALSSLPTSNESARSQSRGTDHLKDSHGIGSTPASLSVPCPTETWCAPSAAKLSEQGNTTLSFAPNSAWAERGARALHSMWYSLVSFAKNPSQFSSAISPVRTVQNRASVHETAQALPVKVYNFTVANCPEYVADGILTHNCDAFADGVTLLLGKGTSILSSAALGEDKGARAKHKIREAMNHAANARANGDGALANFIEENAK